MPEASYTEIERFAKRKETLQKKKKEMYEYFDERNKTNDLFIVLISPTKKQQQTK